MLTKVRHPKHLSYMRERKVENLGKNRDVLRLVYRTGFSTGQALQSQPKVSPRQLCLVGKCVEHSGVGEMELFDRSHPRLSDNFPMLP